MFPVYDVIATPTGWTAFSASGYPIHALRFVLDFYRNWMSFKLVFDIEESESCQPDIAIHGMACNAILDVGCMASALEQTPYFQPPFLPSSIC